MIDDQPPSTLPRPRDILRRRKGNSYWYRRSGKELQIDSPGVINLVLLSGVTLLAAVVQGTVGFGFTLLAVSFFLLILQPTAAIQLLIVSTPTDGQVVFWGYATTGLPLMFIGYFLLSVPVVLIVAWLASPVISRVLGSGNRIWCRAVRRLGLAPIRLYRRFTFHRGRRRVGTGNFPIV